jgi:hypothetical protein
MSEHRPFGLKLDGAITGEPQLYLRRLPAPSARPDATRTLPASTRWRAFASAVGWALRHLPRNAATRPGFAP